MANNFDFSGYATKNDIKCSDGRTIRKGAFARNNGTKVPLVWQHLHDSPENVLGHATLENREDGVYAYGYFNKSPKANQARELVGNGDITSLSIYANQLKQDGGNVLHGLIREVSLVLSGANPEATIENISFAHADGTEELIGEEAIISTNIALEDLELSHSDGKEETVGDVFNTLNEKQKNVVYAMLAEVEGASKVKHEDEEGETFMKYNVFEHSGKAAEKQGPTLTHADFQSVMAKAKQIGSLKEAFTDFLAHDDRFSLKHDGETGPGVSYGITDIEYLFPDARNVSDTPEVISRNMEWVNGVLSGTKHSPFSRIKSMAVDLTADKARALGYVKGNLKKEEVISLLKRVTTPTTIYKKQKLDRDDIIDITDMNVVAWLKAEMRVMLNEEMARAILIGDGRDAESDDKINESNIRPIYSDADMYAHKLEIASDVVGDGIIEAIIRARPEYKGSGTPTLFTTEDILTDMLLIKDKLGRRLYPTVTELRSILRVKSIVTVEPMESITGLIGIMVNLSDYTVGADKGGKIAMFDDFDIDYNQYKYLMEGRMSGALVKPKSAIVIKRASGTEVTPTVPTFAPSTGVLTVPTKTGVSYYSVSDLGVETLLSAGAQTAVDGGSVISIVAYPNATYYFPANINTTWEFLSEKA